MLDRAPMSAPWPNMPGPVFAYGFSWRKRAIVRRFVKGVSISFVRAASAIPSGATVLLWGGAPLPPGAPEDVHVIRLEDGFLRSVGLGADLVQPLSWVVDSRGIYFDATHPSDLEWLLSHTTFSDELLARARGLRERIVSQGLTKYNVGHRDWTRPPHVHRVILVPGQVESDASIRLGAPGICTNLGLLQAVRRSNPDAYVIYKPHPDVVAGLRARGEGESEARAWCDDIVGPVAMGDLFGQVDEVHTLTSLTGFEALLRGKQVSCYGMPFYAGWGLTQDALAISRRTRSLTLDELVAGALILYPRYVSPEGRQLAPETVLDELLAQRERASAAGLLSWRDGQRALLRLALRIGGISR